MSKRAKLAIAIAAAMLVCVLTILTVANREPRYQGLTMGQWASQDYHDPEAHEALLNLGTNNLDLLVKRLSYDSQKDLLWRAAIKLPPRWQNKFQRYRSRRTVAVFEAMRVFERLGTNATPAIPKLQRLVKGGGEPAGNALQALSYLGGEGLAIVASEATQSNETVRVYVVTILALHPQSRVARMALTNAIDDPVPRVRKLAWFGITNGITHY